MIALLNQTLVKENKCPTNYSQARHQISSPLGAGGGYSAAGIVRTSEIKAYVGYRDVKLNMMYITKKVNTKA